MAKTVSYSASLVTRKTNSSSNTKSDRASQEYYENTYNYVGIIHFSGMNLANKVITGISFNITSTAAGLGVSHLKTVYFRRSNYQAPAQSGVTGAGYCGTALGTMTGYYYNNTSTNVVSGSLLTQMAAYFAQGNNTLCIYNPSPSASSHGYSTNYLQWSSVIVTVTYEEPSSVPTMSAYTITMADDFVVPQIHVQRQFVIDAFDVKCRHIADDTLERPVHVHLREQQIGVDPALFARLPVAIMPRLALDSGRLAALVRIWV